MTSQPPDSAAGQRSPGTATLKANGTTSTRAPAAGTPAAGNPVQAGAIAGADRPMMSLQKGELSGCKSIIAAFDTTTRFSRRWDCQDGLWRLTSAPAFAPDTSASTAPTDEGNYIVGLAIALAFTIVVWAVLVVLVARALHS